MSRTVGVGVVLVVLGSFMVAPSSGVASVPVAVPLVSGLSAPAAFAAKKTKKGRLKVVVNGTGSYSLLGKGFRRTSSTSKMFKLRVGKYRVTADAGSVSPAKIRVKAGKTARVTVTFASNSPAVPPSEGNPPAASPSPSQTPGDPTPPPPPDQTIVASRNVWLAPGSAKVLDLSPEIGALESLPDGSEGLVSWTVSNGQLSVTVATGAAPGQIQATVNGTGCSGSGQCGLPIALSLTVNVQSLEAPSDKPLAALTDPSPDRIAAGLDVVGGAGRQLLDEVTIVLGTAQAPGSRQSADTIAGSVGAVVVGGLEQYGIYQLRWTTGQDIDARIAQLRTKTGVAGVDVGLLMTDPAASPGSAVPPSEMGKGTDHTWPLTQMRAPLAWRTTTGSDVPVGIVDGWVVDDHKELNIKWRDPRFALPSAENKGYDHATHVAGLACAKDNSGDTVGVSWGCPLISSAGTYSPKKWNANTSAQSLSSTITAIHDVLDRGAKVVNISLGWNPQEWLKYGACLTQSDSDKMAAQFGQGTNNETSNQFYRIALTSDAVFTLSAGNNCAPVGGSPFTSADSLDNVISVAAVNSNGHLAAFSNWGAEVAAGGGAATADIGNEDGVWSTVPDDAYSQKSGTSMAAPLVAGVAALVRSASPTMTAREAGRCITGSAGTSTGSATTRDDDLPSDYSPKITFSGSLPIVDAAAAVTCGTDPPEHPKTADDYIARNPNTGRAVLVENSKSYAIPDGGTFNCLAKSRVVWDIPHLKALLHEPPGSVAGCVTSDQGNWTYTPTASGGNTGTRIILRDTSTTPHSNYLINGAGEIQAITDGGTYLCLAASTPVIWNTPKDKIDAWKPVAGPAGCGLQGDLVQVNTAANGTPSNWGTTGTTGYQFSPDGTSAVITDGGTNLVPEVSAQYQTHIYTKRFDTGSIQLVDKDSLGSPGDGSSGDATWSPDGTKAAFSSSSKNLVADDTNNLGDIFVKTLASGAVQRINTDKNGTQAAGDHWYGGAYDPVWSPDGSKIAFNSGATNLVPDDTNGTSDVFVKTLASGAIQRINTDSSGKQADGSPQSGPQWSPDGTRIAFTSAATNLVPGDTNGTSDVFVKTLASGATQRVSTGSAGVQSNGGSYSYALWSPDGSRLAFSSYATNLVSGDTNSSSDVFVKTLASGAIQRISTDKAGKQGNYSSSNPAWSPDGAKIAFDSSATNLVPGDTNGIPDVFLKTLSTGDVARASTDQWGTQRTNGGGLGPVFSQDGGRILFRGWDRALWMKTL